MIATSNCERHHPVNKSYQCEHNGLRWDLKDKPISFHNQCSSFDIFWSSPNKKARFALHSSTAGLKSNWVYQLLGGSSLTDPLTKDSLNFTDLSTPSVPLKKLPIASVSWVRLGFELACQHPTALLLHLGSGGIQYFKFSHSALASL